MWFGNAVLLIGCMLLQCLDCIQQDGAADLPAGCQVAMVVNNLGSTPVMEMYIAARAALKYAQDKHKVQSPHRHCVLRRYKCLVDHFALSL